MAFEVPPLPYDYDALEPHIDEQTMRVHHDKHHQAYVDKANAALEGIDSAHESVEHILTIVDTLPEDKQTVVRNNAGGHANHSMFWEIMSPEGGGEPEGELADAINDSFGSLDELKKAVNDAGVARFGSGWTWLVYDGTGLEVYSTANQDSPILQSARADPRQRRLGARLLPQVPEPPPRLSRGLVERGQLASGSRALREGDRQGPRRDLGICEQQRGRGTPPRPLDYLQPRYRRRKLRVWLVPKM